MGLGNTTYYIQRVSDYSRIASHHVHKFLFKVLHAVNCIGGGYWVASI
jgi:hypothetical protein